MFHVPTFPMDVFTPEKRSEVMSKIRGHDTRPELALRSLLHRHGYRFTIRARKTKPSPAVPISSCRNTTPSSSSMAASGTATNTANTSASRNPAAIGGP